MSTKTSTPKVNFHTTRGGSIAPLLLLCSNESTERVGLLLQFGALVVGESELAFGPGLEAKGDAGLRFVHEVHLHEVEQLGKFGAAALRHVLSTSTTNGHLLAESYGRVLEDAHIH